MSSHPNDLRLDIQEKGASREGQSQTLNSRLFMQLQVFGSCNDSSVLLHSLKQNGFEGVVYEDVNDPRGVGILAMSEDPKYFVTRLRRQLTDEAFRAVVQKHEYTMLGRTYSTGFEGDLQDWLLKRPLRTCLNPEWPWAIWYPLRRTGAFARLSPQEQGAILREHATIGRAYGEADLGHDVRLACYGLDTHDNDFVIGLIGRELYPLSHIVQAMRKTKQTSEYIQAMGPFFVGHVLWQSSLKPD
ncbi:MAG: chlorite dismutase family protein [Acidobacteriota bacterium]